MFKRLCSPFLMSIYMSVTAMDIYGGEQFELKTITCPGQYGIHLQGVCIDDQNDLFWSFTTQLVKTDSEDQLLLSIPVQSHHGDLCFHDGKVFVAVNLGKFNQPAGMADSWVYEYDAKTLSELARHPVPEVVHGAGGVGSHDGKFLVVGGLPDGIGENYLYEYDDNWIFYKKHILKSGQTFKGIQTITYQDGFWWMGCYGSPRILLKADDDFQFVGRWPFDCALGLVNVTNGHFLVARDPRKPGELHRGTLTPAVVTQDGTIELLNETLPVEK